MSFDHRSTEDRRQPDLGEAMTGGAVARQSAKALLRDRISLERRLAREHELRAEELQSLADCLPERLAAGAEALLWDLLAASRPVRP